MKTKGRTAKKMTTSMFRMVQMPFLISAALFDAMLSGDGKERLRTPSHRISKHARAKRHAKQTA